MQPFNPYATPAAAPQINEVTTLPLRYHHPRGLGLKWGLFAAACASSIAWLGVVHGGRAVGFVAEPALAGALFAWGTIACAWMHIAWSALPAKRRESARITPKSATLKLFIPLYNFFWIFAVCGALCDAMNAELARMGSALRAPKALGVLACAATLLLFMAPVLLVVVGVLWFFFVFECDKARLLLAQNTFDD